MYDTITAAPGWALVGAVDPKGLTDARLQLHHAAQLVVSVAISYLPPRDDDGHTSMEWVPRLAALAIEPITPDGLRFGLRMADLTLVTIDRHGAVGGSLALHGHTNAEALVWLASEVRRAGLDEVRLTTRKHYHIPPHEVASGAPYQSRAAHAELARYYHDGWLVASRMAPRDVVQGPVRCWPHHFDLARLLTLPDRAGLPARTIGVGLSPGDASYAEPYFYVSPYPCPPADRLRPLAHGVWHTAGWLGAVLTASALVDVARVHDQQQRVTAHAEEAVAVCRGLLEELQLDS